MCWSEAEVLCLVPSRVAVLPQMGDAAGAGAEVVESFESVRVQHFRRQCILLNV